MSPLYSQLKYLSTPLYSREVLTKCLFPRRGWETICPLCPPTPVLTISKGCTPLNLKGNSFKEIPGMDDTNEPKDEKDKPWYEVSLRCILLFPFVTLPPSFYLILDYNLRSFPPSDTHRVNNDFVFYSLCVCDLLTFKSFYGPSY
jgi:hypothetical protein